MCPLCYQPGHDRRRPLHLHRKRLLEPTLSMWDLSRLRSITQSLVKGGRGKIWAEGSRGPVRLMPMGKYDLPCPQGHNTPWSSLGAEMVWCPCYLHHGLRDLL